MKIVLFWLLRNFNLKDIVLLLFVVVITETVFERQNQTLKPEKHK